MSASTGLRIVVADDNRATAFSLGKVLEKRGHSVRLALNGLAAMDVVRDFKPDVALVDIGMPAVDGHELTRQIRHEPGLENTTIIIISGYSRDEDIRRSQEAGADRHLSKPIDFDKLWAILDEAAHA